MNAERTELKKMQAQIDLCFEHLRVVVDIWGSDADIITKAVRLGMQEAITRQRLLQIQAEVPPSYHSGEVVDVDEYFGKRLSVYGVPYRVAEQHVDVEQEAANVPDGTKRSWIGNP